MISLERGKERERWRERERERERKNFADAEAHRWCTDKESPMC